MSTTIVGVFNDNLPSPPLTPYHTYLDSEKKAILYPNSSPNPSPIQNQIQIQTQIQNQNQIQTQNQTQNQTQIQTQIQTQTQTQNQTQTIKKVKFCIPPPQYIKNEDMLRNRYRSMLEDHVQINDEHIPYPYAIEKLHSIGGRVINKKTKDAIPLRVYEIDKEIYEDYWVHPLFLSLQSFQFFKLFEEIKSNQEEGLIEIEVPSLAAFRYILYWMYTGDRTKLLEVAKSNKNLCKGVIENIKYLEIFIPFF